MCIKRRKEIALLAKSIQGIGRGHVLFLFLYLLATPLHAQGPVSIIPHFAIGNGLSAEIYLFNLSDKNPASINLEAFDDKGAPIPWLSQGGVNVWNVTLATRQRRSFQIGNSVVPNNGWIRVTSVVPVGAVLKFIIPNVGTCAIPAIQASSTFSIPVRKDAIGGLDTGIAAAAATVTGFATPITFELHNSDGSIGTSRTISLPTNGHLAMMLEDLFPDVEWPASGSLPFLGTLIIKSSIPIAASAFEIGGNPIQFTSMPTIPQ